MNEINRRNFIKGAGASGAAVVTAGMIGPKVWAQANDKIRVACVGIYGRGTEHIRSFSRMDGVDLVALCDVDEQVLAKRAKDLEKAQSDQAQAKGLPAPKPIKTYTDMRKLFEDKEIDAVSFATPNHWHALGAIWACQAGKDVYVEKPCSHNVWEGRQIVKAARKYNRIVQIGTQSRSSEALREGMQKLKEGVIGDVYMARGLCYKWRPTIGKQTPADPPNGFNYDLWTGPAEMLPYRKFHPYKWHWFWNTGNGDIGNQGIHEMDKARWGLGVGLPTKVGAMGGKFLFDDDQETPNTLVATFRYPEQNKMLVFEVRHWMTNDEGGIKEKGENAVGNIFYGREGYMVIPDYSSYQIFLGKKGEAQPKVSRGGDHFGNFIQAVRSRKIEDLHADIEEGHLSSSLCHLANISHRLGRTLDFDPKTERFTSDEEANKMLTREYRKPFVITDEV